ncbi:hypothetical protein BT96DRAFT_266380 [Gymnopus androsaceus JB14]|uniref:Cyanovirin-N domain-containing protein n=1 Tax=Gymnopus androsaceus JB14 TaxID=1447944 RepID=A0A6A4I6S6_9AGAR|nr:hypothetical protein BT96DRAFT_266380 [Gymnopus androsaceus JB14]
MSSSNGTTLPPTLVATHLISSLNGASTPPPSYLAVTKQNGTATSHSSNTSKVSTKTSHSSTTSEVSIKSSSEYRSSSFFKHTVSSLHLDGDILHAQCLKSDGTYGSSKLNLSECIGVVCGKLVWGRRDFRSHCKSVKLEKYTLIAECVYEGETIKSTLDLTRYLQSYDGTLGLKVAKPSPELSSLFSESRWMKFKIVTEPDASMVIQNAAFKDAFSSIAQTTSKHVVAEMTEDLVESVTETIKRSLRDKVKVEMTRVISETMKRQVRDTLSVRIEEAFAAAKKSVLVACNTVIDEAVNKVTVECTKSIIEPIGDDVVSQCSVAIAKAVTSVTETTVEHFQERVEILLEREMVSASLHRANTEASFLKMLQHVV